MDTFKTDDAVRTWMLDNTGLLSTEYKVHTVGTILPEGMYVTLANPLNKWCSIHTVLKTMQDHGYDVTYSDQYGPTAIILN